MAAKKGGNASRKMKKGEQVAARKSRKSSAISARDVSGIVCVLLGAFTVLTMFTKSALITGLYYKLVCGLIGTAGFYVLPVMLLMIGFLLLLRGKRPVMWRVICAVITIVAVAGVSHLFLTDNEALAWRAVGTLWRDGIQGDSGGLIGGLVGIALYQGFSFGAYFILLLLILICLLTSMNFSPASIFHAVKNRPRPDPPKEEEPYVTPAEKLVNRVAERQIERSAMRSAAKKKVQDFDLPVDDPPRPEQQPKKKRRAKVTSPDEYVLAQREAAKQEVPPKSSAELVQEELERMESAPAKAPEQPEHPAQPEQPEQSKRPAQPEEPGEPEGPVKEAECPAQPPVQTTLDLPEKVKPEEARRSAEEIAMEIEQQEQAAEYRFPPVELLHAVNGAAVDGTNEMRENSRRLAETLKSFGVEPHIVNVTRGPSVTRYEIELERGVKLSKITGLADDIALALGATGVRISAIPDKISVVGIEVPNKLVSTVYIREVIDSPQFRASKSAISFGVGKDINGNCIVDDIAKLPHMLIAGTTGSGKSVCMNTIIISLLYKSKPEDVRLIMVDPKMVELGVYNGIPHLLIPVVTDPKKAAGALQWAVAEMLRRYRVMSEAGVRGMDSYNKLIANDPEQKKLEQIVVIIDELADLMLVAAKEVEESICRIAQMGRAAGIHLIIATQRPSSDVITGLMKANIPSRIAFAVASAMESRIILDTAGAEKLVGKGDMLFAPLGKGKPKRIQGCFITDDEVQSVVDFIKNQGQVEYSEEILEQIEQRAEQSGKGGAAAPAKEQEPEGDELLPAAVEVILETGQASVSMLQRRLKLGYARAARIVDEMEERGIVGPYEGSKPRQLLITKEQWQAMQAGGFTPPVEDETP